jgi:hypothetical protein
MGAILSDPGSRPLRARTEPSANTIADLVALVAGVALAAALEWYSGWGSRQGLGGTPAPHWYVLLYYLNEGVQKGLVAMIPVVVSRRARYGGPVRPAEFLALSSGVPRLLLSFERLPVLGLVIQMPGNQVNYQVNIERYRLWMLTELVVSALAVALAAGLRRRLALWVTCSLLVGAWVALGPVEGFIHEGRDAILDRVQLPNWEARLFNDLLAMPFLVFRMIPLVLAATDAFRGDRAGRTWVERACLGLALISFLGGRLVYYSRMSLNRPGGGSLNAITIDLVELMIAMALSLAIVRRYGPVLGRWFGLIELPSHEESVTAEV